MPIGIDLSKAKDIHRDNIRRVRDSLLQLQDIEMMKAQEAKASTKDIIAQKQALRDAPGAEAIEAATTAEELKNSWNAELLGDSPYK